jgi:uncharacterized membrane protein
MFSRRSILYTLGSLNLLLVFLSLFSAKLVLPYWLQLVGRLHPVLLHFPVAILLLSILLYIARNTFRNDQKNLLTILFTVASATATIAALFGLFLSRDGGYEEITLRNHQWLGVAISLLAFLLYILHLSPGKATMAFMILTIPVLLAGSHFGAVLTHGEDYLSVQKPEPEEKQVTITDSSKIFAALIQPLLKTKCYSCHNDKKAKGEFIMTSMVSLFKGGKNGHPWVAGDPLKSNLLLRLRLAEDDKKHMPPRGKPQLSEEEISLIHEWIKQGADTGKRFIDYPETDSFRIFLAAYMPSSDLPQYAFPAADASKVQQLNAPLRSISPVALGSPALAVRFSIRSGFSGKMIQELEHIAPQIVSLNCDGMPLKDADLQWLKKFEHLERLNLNNTEVTGAGFASLTTLKNLQSIAISGAPIDKKNLTTLTSISSLKKIYCWNTAIKETDIVALNKLNPAISWDQGNIPDPEELLQLTPPQFKDLETTILKKGDTLILKHPMPGVTIRYTLDGSLPDSLASPIYDQPIIIDKASRLRAIATRPGWLTSDTTDRTLFIASSMPVFTKLLSKPDSNYKLNGAWSLLDGKKGDMNNIRENWLGFHGVPCEVSFSFDMPMPFTEIVVSTLKKTGPHILPPDHIELWAGNDSLKLKKISSIVPLQPKKYEADKIEAQVLNNDAAYRYYRIKVFPVKALPKWHDSRGKKVWIFLDEVFFN